MTPSYGFDSPGDLLAKARRELNAPDDALWKQDETAVGDAVFDLGVALSSVRDWLRVHPSASFQPTDVEAYFDRNPALTTFKDMKTDGARLHILAHARDAVAAWESFLATHGVRS